MRYSPDQPRDEKGRFGAGSGDAHEGKGHFSYSGSDEDEDSGSTIHHYEGDADQAAGGTTVHSEVTTDGKMIVSEENHGGRGNADWEQKFEGSVKEGKAYLSDKYGISGKRSFRYSADQPRDEKGRFGSGTMNKEGDIHGQHFGLDPRSAHSDQEHESAANSHTDAADDHEDQAQGALERGSAAADHDEQKVADAYQKAATAHMEAAADHHVAAAAHAEAQKYQKSAPGLAFTEVHTAAAQRLSREAIASSGKAESLTSKALALDAKLTS